MIGTKAGEGGGGTTPTFPSEVVVGSGLSGIGTASGAGAVVTGIGIGAGASEVVVLVVVVATVCFIAAITTAVLGATPGVVQAGGFTLLSGLPTRNVVDPLADTPVTRVLAGRTLAGYTAVTVALLPTVAP